MEHEREARATMRGMGRNGKLRGSKEYDMVYHTLIADSGT